MGEGDAIQVCAHTPIERRTREWERKRLGGIEDQISSRRDRMRPRTVRTDELGLALDSCERDNERACSANIAFAFAL